MEKLQYLKELTIRRNKLTTLPSRMDAEFLARIKNLDLTENPITDPHLQQYGSYVLSLCFS